MPVETAIRGLGDQRLLQGLVGLSLVAAATYCGYRAGKFSADGGSLSDEVRRKLSGDAETDGGSTRYAETDSEDEAPRRRGNSGFAMVGNPR